MTDDERQHDSEAAQWRRLGELSRDLAATDKGLGVLEQRMQALEQRQDRQRETILRARQVAHREHREEMAKLGEIEGLLNQFRGALVIGKWMLRLAALVGAVWVAVKSGDWAGVWKSLGGVAK